MTKGEINYKNGKIYKIEPICEHDEGDVYIGSTTKQYLSQRMTAHRTDYKRYKEGKRTKTMSYDLFDKYGIENCDIILLELVGANSKDELHTREAHYIKTIKCINKYVPLRTKQEYEDHNPEQVRKNKDEFNKKRREKRQVECGMSEDEIKYVNEKFDIIVSLMGPSMFESKYDHTPKKKRWVLREHCQRMSSYTSSILNYDDTLYNPK